MDLEYIYDPTKRGLIYSKPGNQHKARTHEEVAKDTPEEGYESGLAKQTPMCPSRVMGLYDA
jgi:hypothetical protein